MSHRAYYNEIDPYAAEWLRNLMREGLIAPGDVDERSIRQLHPIDLIGYTQCHFFAGIGVWSYTLRLAGWPDDRPVWTGSCPCQPFSAAGKGKGAADARHLWPEWFRLIREHRPVAIFGEQVSAAIRHGWLDLVSADLEGLDYAIGATVMGAHSVGAPHIRQRLYFVADSQCAERRSIDHARGNEGQHGIFQREESADRIGSRIETSIGADAMPAGRPERRPGARDGQTTGSGCACRLEHAHGAGKDERPPSGQQSLCDEHGACGVAQGDTEQPGLEGHGGHGVDGNQPGRIRAHEAGSIGAAGAVGGFWRDADWIYCRGFGTIPPSYRPVEPGSFPLVAGIAARMDKLRAFGNCIVAPQATEFVRAYCGVTD
ncbi:MAG: DNA cytosine methyltransferase [Deltaproteobacteria bacterium]|nr:DNA cytosine methyltransferase [Deltaproteobacteria bacterium]